MAATSGMIRSAMTYILKEQYGPQLVNLLVEETDLLKEFEKKEFDLRGNEFVVPLQVGTNEGIGAGADTTALPTAGVPTFRQGLFKSKQQRAAVRVTKESMDITKGNVGSWISAWDFSLRDATFNLRNHLDIMLYGNGTGELAHVTEGYRAATATPKLSQPTRAPKPAPPPPKPKHRVIYGGGRVIVLPDEPEEPKK